MPLKDIIKSISGENKSKSFQKIVFVEFPLQGTHSIGFVTNEGIMVNGIAKEAVFIPTTPNPTNGFLIYVDTSSYTELDISVNVALRTIVSLGTMSPEILGTKTNQNKLE
ncbi:MAG: DUF502 domain-containing protein [Vallitaleaceae bacterium]|jgi:uncharacterized membrane protein|nr:DUF502 domain-containing protein [Vallitaleaceae bacterium]